MIYDRSTGSVLFGSVRFPPKKTKKKNKKKNELHAHAHCNATAHAIIDTGIFRLVDTKFADCAELNSCSQNLDHCIYMTVYCARLNLSCTCANSTGQPT